MAHYEDPSQFAYGLVVAAKRLGMLGRKTSKLALLDRACHAKNVWSYQRLRLGTALALPDFAAAERILAEIEADPPEGTEADWLDICRRKIFRRVVDEPDIQARLNAKRPRQYQPVTGRILYFLHNSLPYSSGGYATRGHGLLQGMRRIGYDMICVTRPGFPNDIIPVEAGDVPALDTIDGIDYHRITSPSRKDQIGHVYLVASADRIEQKLRELRPELVIAASNHLTSLPAQMAAARLGIPFIYEVRGFWEVTRASREPEFLETETYATLSRLEAMSAKAADHVFTLTGGMRDELIRRGVAADNISLLPNSCDPWKFLPQQRDHALAAALNIPEGVPVIGYIGSFVQYEGLDDLARAAAILKRRGVEFRLLLVGNENVSNQSKGPITAAIEAAAAEGGLADWLIMPGRIPHEAVAAHYSLIDIAPFPRKPQLVTEMVSPMKPLEAMSMEKAVLASSVHALSEMIDHDRTGLLFEKGNITAMADALHRLVGDSALRRRLGKAGREWVVNERTWPMTAQKARAQISRVLAAHEGGAGLRPYQPVPAHRDPAAEPARSAMRRSAAETAD
ncbi:MAG: glycosyltransferase family 4 protein [Paracoccus sp. (in: a-proteobacteria)]|nr:glycosyltransferase family 4 protein [Paracoccus sp. (in: a-proteobacteria)]